MARDSPREPGGDIPRMHERFEGGSFTPSGSDAYRELILYRRRSGDHVQRYRFALRGIRPGRVFESGCGPGLGALLLRGRLGEYVATDTDSSALGWARANVAPLVPGARFIDPTEVARAGLGKGCDLVISYEVIEHVSGEPAAYLESLRALLSDGGRLVVSTPNGLLSRGDPRLFQSRYHTREYRPDELRQLLGAAGFTADLYAQGRVDLVDALPAELLRRARWINLGSPAGPSGPAPASMGAEVLRAAWGRVPSPERMWRIRPYSEESFACREASHLIAVCQADR